MAEMGWAKRGGDVRPVRLCSGIVRGQIGRSLRFGRDDAVRVLGRAGSPLLVGRALLDPGLRSRGGCGGG